eukprot:364498-Chlamydomonas_euryale.AAC.3
MPHAPSPQPQATRPTPKPPSHARSKHKRSPGMNPARRRVPSVAPPAPPAQHPARPASRWLPPAQRPSPPPRHAALPPPKQANPARPRAPRAAPQLPRLTPCRPRHPPCCVHLRAPCRASCDRAAARHAPPGIHRKQAGGRGGVLFDEGFGVAQQRIFRLVVSIAGELRRGRGPGSGLWPVAALGAPRRWREAGRAPSPGSSSQESWDSPGTKRASVPAAYTPAHSRIRKHAVFASGVGRELCGICPDEAVISSPARPHESTLSLPCVHVSCFKACHLCNPPESVQPARAHFHTCVTLLRQASVPHLCPHPPR